MRVIGRLRVPLVLALLLPLRAWALSEFVFSTDELPLGATVDLKIRLLSDENVNAWSGVWSVDPAEIEIIGILAEDLGTFVSSDSMRFSFNGFSVFGQPAGFDVATVTLRRLTEGGSIELVRGAIGEATGGYTDLMPPRTPPLVMSSVSPCPSRVTGSQSGPSRTTMRASTTRHPVPAATPDRPTSSDAAITARRRT